MNIFCRMFELINFVFLVPYIVIQLYNENQQTAHFLNVLIQVFVSSTCFEHHVFIIRKTICTCSFYGMFFKCLCKQASRWKDVLVTNGLPDDEHMMFETCVRHEELN